MLFNSFSFAIFLPVVFFLYYILPARFRIYILLLSSYYFYMSWNIKYVFLILFTTIVTYFAALLMEKAENTEKRSIWFASAITISFALLFFFKYFDFSSGLLCAIGNFAGLKLHPVTLSLLLPVGISFYTFQTVSYLTDVYKKKINAERNFIYFAAFISFFPQLVAGPIERTENLLPQLRTLKDFDRSKAEYGLKMIAWGLFKKMIIADSIAPGVDFAYGNCGTVHGATLFIATLLFAVQIYCDFSGYSDIAIGSAKLFGVDLMQNFRMPYLASSFRDFWARWHISLSTWFKDYLYIPMGGNRKGKLRQYINLLLTFSVSGLWHGANLTFVVWGLIHGILLTGENMMKKTRENMKKKWGICYRIIMVFPVFFLTSFAWIFFRSNSLNESTFVLARIFSSFLSPDVFFRKIIFAYREMGFPTSEYLKILIVLLILFLYDLYSELFTDALKKIQTWNRISRWGFYIFIGLLLIFFQPLKSGTGFIYFQF
ncbi:MAG: MBOAT family protein [Lentisphaeria bacterium]|nr:MBOAT family protein [Lentisphaeria bacterium]